MPCLTSVIFCSAAGGGKTRDTPLLRQMRGYVDARLATATPEDRGQLREMLLRWNSTEKAKR